MHKIPPIDIHCHIQAVYGDKCVDVSTVSCWVQQFEQEEVGEVVVSGGGGVGPFFLWMEFKNMLNTGESTLKLEEIRRKSDYAQL